MRRAAVALLLASLAAGPGRSQSPARVQGPGEPLVFGRQSAWLRTADVEGIARAVAQYGGPPWLITEIRRSIANRNGEFQWSALAYVAPATATAELRRGPLVRVLAELTTDQLPDPATWRTDPSIRTWAQVVLPGRTFEDVASEQDENLPLWISGDITDADLISVVRFLRSGPKISAPTNLRLGQVPGPVRGVRGSVIRHPALPGARVVIGLTAGCFYDIVLERRGETWIGEVEGGVGCGSDSASSSPTIKPER